jgi:hypothetical protein
MHRQWLANEASRCQERALRFRILTRENALLVHGTAGHDRGNPSAHAIAGAETAEHV